MFMNELFGPRPTNPLAYMFKKSPVTSVAPNMVIFKEGSPEYVKLAFVCSHVPVTFPPAY